MDNIPIPIWTFILGAVVGAAPFVYPLISAIRANERIMSQFMARSLTEYRSTNHLADGIHPAPIVKHKEAEVRDPAIAGPRIVS